MLSFEIVEADLSRQEHQRAVVDLTDAYAQDPMANGKPLPDAVRQSLVEGLRRHPTTTILLATHEGEAIGLATCFLGFSTFAARPLLNIHDLAVVPEWRGKGVGRLLLNAVERKARELGCCKLTLEVLENNRVARRLYEAVGFGQAEYGEGTGGALFFAKKLL